MWEGKASGNFYYIVLTNEISYTLFRNHQEFKLIEKSAELSQWINHGEVTGKATGSAPLHMTWSLTWASCLVFTEFCLSQFCQVPIPSDCLQVGVRWVFGCGHFQQHELILWWDLLAWIMIFVCIILMVYIKNESLLESLGMVTCLCIYN